MVGADTQIIGVVSKQGEITGAGNGRQRIDGEIETEGDQDESPVALQQ